MINTIAVDIRAKADSIPKNPQLVNANLQKSIVQRGELFEIELEVDAFNGYIYSYNASFFTRDYKYSFDCRGYQPVARDSSKILAVQKGKLTLNCKVPRISSEGQYQLLYLDLSSVGCPIKYVMDISNPAGISCPHSWTHYAYKNNWGDAYATENQQTSLNYPTTVFESFPKITVSGYQNFEVPNLELVKAYPNRISATYYYGSGWDSDTTSLCAASSDVGNLTTNWVLLAPSLPLNGAAQPNFPEIVYVNVADLLPNTVVNINLLCKTTDGQTSNRKFEFRTTLPDPPSKPLLRIFEVQASEARILIENFKNVENIYSISLNGVSFVLNGDSILFSDLAPNKTYFVVAAVTDKYGQSSFSENYNFKTLSKMITIKCTKGKTVKTISGINPKCPKGYLQKN